MKAAFIVTGLSEIVGSAPMLSKCCRRSSRFLVPQEIASLRADKERDAREAGELVQVRSVVRRDLWGTGTLLQARKLNTLFATPCHVPNALAVRSVLTRKRSALSR